MSRLLAVTLGMVVLLLWAAGPAQASHWDPEDGGRLQHGGPGGHLPPSSHNVQLVGKVTLTNVPGGISDVSAFGNYAYLGAFSPECIISGGSGGGVHIVDISDPANPVQVGFIPAHPNNFVGEGVHIFSVDTKHFKGQILVHNNEACDASQPHLGGVSLWDVTDPSNPKPLAEGVGDTNPPKPNASASRTHSAQGWAFKGGQQGRAYVAMVDNDEFGDVDILDITDPRNPVQIGEVGILDWPDAQSPLANGNTIFHHDMQLKKIKGHWRLLVSYWDAGWVLLDVDDPANPKFIADSDHPAPDPLTGFQIPEGNAHQAFWSSDAKFILATDEDFSPNRTLFQITTGPNAGPYGAGEFGWTIPISTKFPNGLSGPTIWGGSGCVEDLNGNGISDRDEVPPASSLPANPGEAKIVVFSRGVCFFSIKVESGQLAGYDAVIIGQSHAGSRAGLVPDSFICGGQGHLFTITASAICVGHRGMHLLFNDTPEYTPNEGGTFPPGGDLPPIGTLGERVSAESTFDGWGYVHLLDATTLQEIDAYAVPEALDPAFATGFGSLSVHEVKTDPRDGVYLGYISYYDAGVRVVRFGKSGLEEVGHYIDANGNDFWGTFPHILGTDPNSEAAKNATERPYLLMSDRDSGLWIFRYTGP